ncbi:MAG: MBL fold metallo-hydrolase [Clostridia bacterium]|nr:MBL fold metallo-hydrolase [Clostridia bacterium]
MSFTLSEVLPGVWHIADPMDVCVTLLAGEERALLVDTGYGLEDIAACVRSVTDRPTDVLLTHGHHDHALGAHRFERVWLFPEDEPVYRTYTNDHWRRHVLEGARQRGLTVDEQAILAAEMPPCAPPPAAVDLGGMTAHIRCVPGHTPGSAVVWVPERELLLTGDDWNPVTWCFFPEALSVRDYRASVRRLLELPFRYVLCSHRHRLFPREAFESFLNGLTDEAILAAEPSGEGAGMGIDTVTAHPTADGTIVFDRVKAAL